MRMRLLQPRIVENNCFRRTAGAEGGMFFETHGQTDHARAAVKRVALVVITTLFGAGLPTAAYLAANAAPAAATTAVQAIDGGAIAFPPTTGLSTTVDGSIETPGEVDNRTFTLTATTTVYQQWTS